MTDEEAAVVMAGVAEPFTRVGMAKAAEPYLRAAHALRCHGPLVEALEACRRWTPIGEDHSRATKAIALAKECP